MVQLGSDVLAVAIALVACVGFLAAFIALTIAACAIDRATRGRR